MPPEDCTPGPGLTVCIEGPDGRPLRSLDDLLAPGLRAVSIGLNPSLPSVERGFYFANPVNRFWKALARSRLIGASLEPGPEAQRRLLQEYGIGFTDVVKRPTAGAGDLRAADFRHWAPRLHQRLLEVRPRAAWFHGRVAWSRFASVCGLPAGEKRWGLQQTEIDGIAVFVCPNPSPANAAFSLDDIVACWDALADFLKA